MPEILPLLNAEQRDQRLENLRRLLQEPATDPRTLAAGDEVNNHVHTFYSFSPYSPTAAAYKARQAGLKAVGIMDHDSVAGVEEMLEAAAVLGIAATAGCEVRVSFAGTAVEGRKINNPDSETLVYMALHGLPRRSLPEARRFLAPLQDARNARNRAQVERLNQELAKAGLEGLSFENEVRPRSRAGEGGSITERHILEALALRVLALAGPRGVNEFLEERLGLGVQGKAAAYLDDPANPHRVYDLLGVLKGSFLPRFFIQPGSDECLPARQVVSLAESLGAIPAYAYLGDVTESPTGDKKAERFEDSFLPELMQVLKQLGFRAITYMPPRNTLEQLLRLRGLCREFGFMEISGVDINSSRQAFTCPEILRPEFRHLLGSTWALIAHEKLAEVDPGLGLFNPRNPLAGLPLEARLERYAEVGSALDPGDPWESARRVRL